MRNILLIVLLGLSLATFSQKQFSKKVGLTTKDELLLNSYDKDSTATSIVLQEFANLYIDKENDYAFRTDYYKRVKLFNKDDEEKATVTIYLYDKQKVNNIKAITYTLRNGEVKKTFLLDSQIFKKQTSDKWKEVTFTLPNIQEGCIIEYSYSIISPYEKLDDWYFQSDIPKLISEHRSSIPGNWVYKTRLVGFEKLDKDEIFIKKSCLQVPGISKAGDCIVKEYAMYDVPAFEEEDYMLSKKNFLARLSFDLETFTTTDGVTKRYTKTWKDADKTLKKLFFDNQTSKKNYFKKKLPPHLFEISDTLKRAKETFYFLQDRMHWNEKFWTSKDLKIKRVYDIKKGSVDAINLVLHNSLQALGIESYIAVLSTRDHGLPTKLYPVVYDFNYAIVKAVINGEAYFLDLTNKFIPFGEVPMRCLNGEARVLDFKNGSYWEEIIPRSKSSLRTQTVVKLNEDDELVGSLTESKIGYYATKQRNLLYKKTKDDFLDNFETEHPNIEVEDVVIENEENREQPIKMTYNIIADTFSDGNTLTISPFIYGTVTENPFKLKERKYPVDYAYKRTTTHMCTINLPKGYKIKKAPENKGIALPFKAGKYYFKTTQKDNKFIFLTKLSINKKIFSSEEYHYLKEFYNQIIKNQEQLLIIEKQ